LKEGIVTDFTHKEALGRLVRFESSALDKDKLTPLADYVKRMPADQKEIYCLLAANRAAAESSPYFEVFRERKWEVLFLYDPWDEFVMEHLHEFDGKTLRLAEKADLNLSAKKEGALPEDAAKALAKWLKETLGGQVGEVRVSQRLVDSPAVVVDSDKFMTSSMRRIMKAMKQPDSPELPAAKHDFEINPAHPIMARLDAMRQKDAALAGSVAEQLLDNARVSAGLLEDPRAMIVRLNQLLEKVLAK
jgi:molecular chaperone HtpG